MMKKTGIVIISFLVTLLVSLTAFATPPYQDYEDAVTGLMTDLAPVVLTVIGAALVLAAGVMIVRIGFKWVKRFLGGA